MDAGAAPRGKIHTEPSVAEAAQRVSHERRILARLAGVEGVDCLFDARAGGAAGENGGGQTLAQVLAGGPLTVPAWLALALNLARTLAAVHRRGVVHQNINPAHILLSGPEPSPRLVGFHLATTVADARPGFTHHREIRGNLAYLAPEQTGRTGHSVDLRADLYSLGVTLYEAATGRPPFESEDPLRLLHDHLARPAVAPQQLRAELPQVLSDIILRLLEKEPERRYQSAEGLARDLALAQQPAGPGTGALQALGAQDFPMVLSAPARLVGRSAEIAQLGEALEDAVKGRGRIVLVAGASGVGKTSLINELRPMVTARRGWFVSGKFDQYRRDALAAPTQAFRALGRLLLAEPEAELAAQRERILGALGSNAGLMCDTPEFALLLGPQPEVPSVEPAQAEARLLGTAIHLLHAIASPHRPLVMLLDDLQWGGTLAVRFVEALLDADGLPGLLLVVSYRDTEVDAAHPLTALLARQHREVRPPLQLQLSNLPAEDVGEMLREMMRLRQDQAAALAQAVAEHSGGNPYDTVELLNALRRDGVLAPGAQGWQWDAQALRRYVGHSGVLDLLATRVARLPPASQSLMHAVACLGGQVPRGLLSAATGLAAGELDDHLAAPLEDGLLAIELGRDGALRMRHDRVQQAVYGSLGPTQRRALHLGLARRLSATSSFSSAAAQQYLPAVEDITQPQECRHVARLFQAMAVRNRAAANYAAAQGLLAAALSLLSQLAAPTAQDNALRATLEVEHHTALCSLGRFEEADALYGAIERRGVPVEHWVDAACAQIDNLSSRSRPREAVSLGLPLLRQLGLQVPEDFAAADIEQRLTQLGEWVRQLQVGQDARPYTGDLRSTVTARLINRMCFPAYFFDIRIMAWLILEGQLLWTRHGPSPELVPVLAALGAVAVGINRDYRTAFHGSHHVLAVSEARGWEPGTSEARFLVGSHASHWCDPLEHTVRRSQLARDGMLRNGELQSACLSYRPSTTAMLDCSPTIQGWAQEVESGLALSLRIRNDYGIAMMAIERQLLRGLRGEAEVADGWAGEIQDSLQRQANVPTVSLSAHFSRAFLAALFGDAAALVHHAAAAIKPAPFLASYRAAQAQLVHALALAWQARTIPPDQRAAKLAELDAQIDWLAQRAADAPDNFSHLLHWMQGERAWAAAEFRAAAHAFDTALCGVEGLARPWHHAMIAERAGLFHLDQGMGRTGRQFIAQARDLYQAWGAQAKVQQLERTHGFLATGAPAVAAIVAPSVDTIDTMAILRASQALSSETSLVRLKTRVADVMGALTGATEAQLALWDEGLKDWFVFDGRGHDAMRISAQDAGQRGLLPLSAFRYAERTRSPLLVEDAAGDDRFARDPYFAGLAHCSLLIVPILHQGNLRAMLLLENRLSRGAFSTARLDAVSLIAGQLAVSLENALLYDRLEQRVSEQTRELLAAARRSGMAQIATNVLHNVGNVLNSVNVSTHVLRTQVRQSRTSRVGDLALLLERNADDLTAFFGADDRGRRLPGYLRELAQALTTERGELLAELDRLSASVDHIKNVVAMQQSYAGASGALENCIITELVDDALRIQQDALARHRVAVTRDFGPAEPAALDKTRVMQILVNLLENARQAMDGVDGPRGVHVRAAHDAQGLLVSVRDSGCGIGKEHLSRIFSHGFTTKSGGHGFGLHSCAIAAKEMGGALAVHSDGVGTGATFTLRLPLRPAAPLAGGTDHEKAA